jgi:hypothetical protein
MAAPEQRSQISPDGLVSEVVSMELQSADASGYCRYRAQKESPEGSITKEVIETKNWLIGRLVLKNGKPLTPDEEKTEDERLTHLLTDSQALQEERTEKETDNRRVRDLFKSLPEAFQFEYAEAQQREDGALVHLKFHPNPNFDPSNTELRVLTGMEGTMVINRAASRIVRVDAHLVKTVSFAWGIFAYLDPGGTFVLEQGNVGEGRWQVTKLGMHFTGKILVFKSLDIDFIRTNSDFRWMSGNLTLMQGLQLLKTGHER